MGLSNRLYALAKEQPFRFAVRAALKWWPASIETLALWGKSVRPNYLAGVLYGAQQAQEEGARAISVIEFGVASGAGLIELERIAAEVERATGVSIWVYGFDAGPGGMPDLNGDHRDLPDIWRPGDYPMDVPALQAKLSPRTALVLGNVRDTVPKFFPTYDAAPLGFVAIDVDLYSSTTWALEIFTQPGKRMLRHVPMYFDDIDLSAVHRFAGELLAIDEFNESEQSVKIDVWRGIKTNRPYADETWLDKMYMAHDLAAISRCVLRRDPRARTGLRLAPEAPAHT
jgi:hypothetical protein